MRTQHELHSLTREVLGEDVVEFSVKRYTLIEDIEAGTAEITCSVMRLGDKAPLSAVEGRGVGLVDALFAGLKQTLSADYPSLAHIHFVDFRVASHFESAVNVDSPNTDVLGTVHLELANTDGRSFVFESTSLSVGASTVKAVVKGVEHFVNAELAVLKVYSWIDDAKRRNRPDLAEKYVRRLADLVQNASYSETIERRKAESL